ncbi:Granzyme M [Phytophthora nicotianae]|uniref:Granzyme M n=1 Tax=Phytophthora nicotianae TaxID=4792 RepID=A0A0W8D7A7_PHYNI|nr:Granzyme M [Phytophthora nicotianae]
MLLQPLLPSARQPTNARGTFVAKYNITATSSCTRVLLLENGGLYGLLPSQASTAKSEASAQSHQLEEIIMGELRKLVHEVEAAFNDRVRLLTADFQITDMHRLVLVRVSGVVFFSDLVHKKGIPTTTRRSAFEAGGGAQQRKSSIAIDNNRKCAGREFCHCTDILRLDSSGFMGSRSKTTSSQYSTVTKLLERRIFMLQNTLWNPKSAAFDPKALEFEDVRWLPHEYEMVAVCHACNLIYQAIDDERFSRSRETAAAATRRSTELFRSKFLESERATIATLRKRPSTASGIVREAWEDNEEGQA